MLTGFFALTNKEQKALDAINELKSDLDQTAKSKKVGEILATCCEDYDGNDYYYFYIKMSAHSDLVHAYCRQHLQDEWQDALDSYGHTYQYEFLKQKHLCAFDLMAGLMLSEEYDESRRENIVQVGTQTFHALHTAVRWSDRIAEELKKASKSVVVEIQNAESSLAKLIALLPSLIQYHGTPACLLAAVIYNKLGNEYEAEVAIAACRQLAFEHLSAASKLRQCEFCVAEFENIECGQHRLLSKKIETGFGLPHGQFDVIQSPVYYRGLFPQEKFVTESIRVNRCVASFVGFKA